MFQVNIQSNAFNMCIIIYAHVKNIVRIHVYVMNKLIIVIGGHVIHSYGRLVHHEHVITRGDQLLTPGDVTEPGRMDCIRTAPETAHFEFSGGKPSNNLLSQSVDDDDEMATLFFNRSYLSMNTSKNVEGSCRGANRTRDIYFYLYLLPGNIYCQY